MKFKEEKDGFEIMNVYDFMYKKQKKCCDNINKKINDPFVPPMQSTDGKHWGVSEQP